MSMLSSKIREMFNTESDLKDEKYNQRAGSGNYKSLDTAKIAEILRSETNNMYSNTNSESLETQLRNMLTKNRQTGGHNNLQYTNVKNFFNQLKTNGVNVDLKLDGVTLSEYFENNNNLVGGSILTETSNMDSDLFNNKNVFMKGGVNTFSDSISAPVFMKGGANTYSESISVPVFMKGGANQFSETSSASVFMKGGAADLSATSSMMFNKEQQETTTTELSAIMKGGNNTGSRIKLEDLLTTTSSEMPVFNINGGHTDLSSEMADYLQSEINSIIHKGGKGSNPGFEYFLKLRKHVSEKLKMPNGPKAAKIAGKVQNVIKKKYEKDPLSPQDLFNKSKEAFDKDMSKYKD